MVLHDLSNRAEHPALDPQLRRHLHVELLADFNLAPPSLVCHRDLLELVPTELEVQVVQGRVRLEAPGQRAHEIVIEASEAPLLEEQVDPNFKNVRANIQVL